MFKNASQGGLNGFLDTGSHITGELKFDDEFLIHGKLTGNVVSDGKLDIGEKGEVDGEIRVARVTVWGVVRGTLKIAEHVEIKTGGKVFADLHTPSLTIEEGAFFEGRCSMGSESSGERQEASPPVTGRSTNVARMPMAK